jgi:ubiquitin C-terminal hydrolase
MGRQYKLFAGESALLKLMLIIIDRRLFSVVFHHGEKAEGGHYTVDIFHGGSWHHIDDDKIKPVNNDHVLSYQLHRVPYLLFYRRWEPTSSTESQQQ